VGKSARQGLLSHQGRPAWLVEAVVEAVEAVVEAAVEAVVEAVEAAVAAVIAPLPMLLEITALRTTAISTLKFLVPSKTLFWIVVRENALFVAPFGSVMITGIIGGVK
jgi:hypothetical protein